MSDERMSEEEIARIAELVRLRRLCTTAADLLAELRRERARADAAELRARLANTNAQTLADSLQGFVAQMVRPEFATMMGAISGMIATVESGEAPNFVASDLDYGGAAWSLVLQREHGEKPAEQIARVKRERDEAAAHLNRAIDEAAQLKRDRERERDIAAKREREAIVARLRAITIEDMCAVGMQADEYHEAERDLFVAVAEGKSHG